MHSNSEEFMKHHIRNLNKTKKYSQRLYVSLNLMSFFLTMISSIITALLVSKLIYSSYPDWFFFSTAGISALMALFSSLLSFFVVKDNINDANKKIHRIEAEEILFKNKLNDKYKDKKAEFLFYLEIANIMGVSIAKKEVKHEK